MSRAFKKQKRTAFHTVATVPLGTAGVFVSQDHQVSSVRPSSQTETPKSPSLHPAAISSFLAVKGKDLAALPKSIQRPWLAVFTQNINRPTLSASIPPPRGRFENTVQLAHCSNLLRKRLYPPSVATATPDEPLDPAQQAMIESYAQNEHEVNRISSMVQRVVEEFVTDNLKTTTILSEVILLAPSLDKEYYRKLLNCVIAEFETARLLDIALLQRLIQLIESASSDYLEPDDLVRILVVLRTRLQDTYQQSTKRSYYLTWALSRLLDIMVDGKVKDLRQVVDEEPLSAMFNQLEDSGDTFLKHQAMYAFQGLSHIPNNETRRQCMLKHADNITMGLLGVVSVCKLSLSQLRCGADHLYEATLETHEDSTKVADGGRSLIESGQGVWSSVKGGIFSGGRQLWYTSLREAQQHICNGRLHDFNNLIFEAPCRDDINFQWGVCRLLGGIVADPLWDISTRRQAIDLLSTLYKNETFWTPNEDTCYCILSILRMAIALEDSVSSDYALLVLQDLENAGGYGMQKLYRDTIAGPLRSYPIPSTVLSRVLAIPDVEDDLFRLKDFRLKQHERALYIQPQAKPSLQASDDTLFPLMEKALEFLTGPGLVFLLLGDSGGGKSTFNLQLERTLWKTYRTGDPIPLHINLPYIDDPQNDMITKRLQDLDFADTQIMELKRSRQFIVICDGYDESQLTSNLHTSNNFNQPGQWNVKMIVSCRTQYLGSDYRNWFVPRKNGDYDRPTPDLFQEAVIAPFNKEQIERYVDIYVPMEPRTWVTKDYMDRLTTIPNLMDLVKNPFLLSLALEALPGVTSGKHDITTIKITRVQLYDTFVRHWLDVNKKRLQSINVALSAEDRQIFVQLEDAGFVSLGTEYLTKLAQAIFDKQDGKTVVQYNHFKDNNTWKGDFFGSQAEVRLLRDSSPLSRTGNQYRFIHRSMLEYFLSRAIYNPIENDDEFHPQAEIVSTVSQLLDPNCPLSQRDLVKEQSVIHFLCDRVNLDPCFKHQLHVMIDLSKTDANTATAATNAITILVRAGVLFNSVDLRGIRIPGADLSNGQFDSAQLQGADLSRVNLSKSWLRRVDMSYANMKDVRFGELPYLGMDTDVYSCAYSPDGKMLGVALEVGITYIYDTSTWTRTHHMEWHFSRVNSIVFSTDSQRVITGNDDKKIRLWDAASDEDPLVMEGHSKEITSVTISPCGNQIASASYDNTVRLWDVKSGMELLVLEGHGDWVLSVKYSPDGCQLASVSRDGTIRFWDAKTGEPRQVLSPYCGGVNCMSYSPDGRWIAVGFMRGDLRLWDVVSLNPGPVLDRHTGSVTGIEFSPDGRWIASSSNDGTVKLWDASTSALATVFISHSHSVNCIAFSPDSCQIASGGFEDIMRLWEVESSWTSLDPRDGKRVVQLTYSRDGQRILSTKNRGIFQQWVSETGASVPLSFKMPDQSAVSSRAFTMDGRQLAFGYIDGSIRLWDCHTGQAGPVLEGHSKRIHILVYSPCCRWIISVDDGNTVRLWDLYEVNVQSHLVNVGEIPHVFRLGVVTFSSTGGQFANNLAIGSFQIIDTHSRECLSQTALEGDILSMTFSPDDQQIAIGTVRGNIYLRDLQSGGYVATLEGHKNCVQCIAYSPCGQWIASGSRDMIVIIWHRKLSGEVESWSRVHSICSFFGWIDNVAWNPIIPMEFVTSAADGSVQLWRISFDESGDVASKMVWGANLDILCMDSLTFTNASGLNPVYQELLIQRGAIRPEKSTFPHD